jgi:hypothetical protein
MNRRDVNSEVWSKLTGVISDLLEMENSIDPAQAKFGELVRYEVEAIREKLNELAEEANYPFV